MFTKSAGSQEYGGPSRGTLLPRELHSLLASQAIAARWAKSAVR